MSEAAAETNPPEDPQPPAVAPPAPVDPDEPTDPTGESLEIVSDVLKDTEGNPVTLLTKAGVNFSKFIVLQRRMAREGAFISTILDIVDLIYTDESRDEIEAALLDERLDPNSAYAVFAEGLAALAARPTK